MKDNVGPDGAVAAVTLMKTFTSTSKICPSSSFALQLAGKDILET